MRSIKVITSQEDWSYLHSLANVELSRAAGRGCECLDGWYLIFIEKWIPHLKELGPHLSSPHLSYRVSIGEMIDDMRDLSGFFQLVEHDPLRRTRILFCSALVVACRANPDYAPESLFGYLRFLVASARRERKPRVLAHIAAVVRGEAGNEPLAPI